MLCHKLVSYVCSAGTLLSGSWSFCWEFSMAVCPCDWVGSDKLIGPMVHKCNSKDT